MFFSASHSGTLPYVASHLLSFLLWFCPSPKAATGWSQGWPLSPYAFSLGNLICLYDSIINLRLRISKSIYPVFLLSQTHIFNNVLNLPCSMQNSLCYLHLQPKPAFSFIFSTLLNDSLISQSCRPETWGLILDFSLIPITNGHEFWAPNFLIALKSDPPSPFSQTLP